MLRAGLRDSTGLVALTFFTSLGFIVSYVFVVLKRPVEAILANHDSRLIFVSPRDSVLSVGFSDHWLQSNTLGGLSCLLARLSRVVIGNGRAHT